MYMYIGPVLLSCFGFRRLFLLSQPFLLGYLPWRIGAISLSPELSMASRCHGLATYLTCVGLPLLILLPCFFVSPLCSPGDLWSCLHVHLRANSWRFLGHSRGGWTSHSMKRSSGAGSYTWGCISLHPCLSTGVLHLWKVVGI